MNLTTPDDSGMNERKDSGSFLNRWSARKQQSTRQVDDDNVPETGAESDLPDATDLADALPGGILQDELSGNALVSTEPTSERAVKTGDNTELQNQDQVSAGETHALLTDADMPDVATLTASSDISGFLGKGVSAALRKAALRHVFRQPEYNVRDGLDDYDGDYTSFEPLGDTVTSDMKYHAARKERARLASERLAQEQTHEELDVPDRTDPAQAETATIDDESSGKLAEEKIDVDQEAATDDDQERHATVSAGKDDGEQNVDPLLEHLPDQCSDTDTLLNKTSQVTASQPDETPNE